MSRRLLFLLPTVLTAIALPVAPALAGEDDGEPSATLTAKQGCVSGERARAEVTGDQIDSVAYYLDGQHVKTLTEANSGDGDGYVLKMRCRNLSLGAHRARAVVSYESSSETLRFQITRARQGSARFTG